MSAPFRCARVSVLLAAMLGVTACGAIDRSLQRRVATEAAVLEPPADDDAAVHDLAAGVADKGLEAPKNGPIPEVVGLGDYVLIALRDNPGIRRAIRQVQVLGYRVPQVTSLDDPMISFVPPTSDMTQTAGGMLDGGVGVSQKIPFPGKLTSKGHIAEETVRMAFWNLADTRISTVARVQKAYYEYYLADVSIAITEDSQRLLRQIRDVAAARYKAGAATQQDVLRAEVELYQLTNDLLTFQQQRATARALLNALMDRKVDAPLPPPRSFELSAVEWDLPRAMDHAVASNPRLAGLQAQIRRDLEVIKLAKLDYFPDLTAGYTYTFISAGGVSPVATGSDVWNLAFGLNLPIWWQRIRARVLEGNAKALMSVEEYGEVRNEVFFQLQDALVKLDAQYKRAKIFLELIVPRAWQAVEVSTSSYQAGSLEFTALIENWQNWLRLSLAYHRAIADLEQRFADLQQLIGVQVPRSGTEEEADPATRAGATTGNVVAGLVTDPATRAGTTKGADQKTESNP